MVMPKNQFLVLGVTAGMAISTATWAFFRYTGPDLGGDVPGSPKTTSAKWQEASKAYAAAYNMNPIRRFKEEQAQKK